jgi:hypothetical protein
VKKIEFINLDVLDKSRSAEDLVEYNRQFDLLAQYANKRWEILGSHRPDMLLIDLEEVYEQLPESVRWRGKPKPMDGSAK